MPVRRWSRESIIDAMKHHAELHGDPPTSKEWSSVRRPDYAPTPATVRQYFGSWNEAMKAAGFVTRSRGIPGHVIPLERDWRGHLLPR